MGSRTRAAVVSACVVVPLLPVLATSSPAGAIPVGTRAFPGDNGEIAFVSERDGNPEVYTMPADGTGDPDRLTFSGQDDEAPAWSPDGTRLARVIRDSGVTAVYATDRQGGGGFNATGFDGIDVEPAWSPDGRQVVFSSDRDPASVASLWTTSMETVEAPQLLLQPEDGGVATDPTWSPDGSRIAYAATVEDGSTDALAIWVADADGTNAVRLTNPDTEDHRDPDWSPDGTRIVYTDQAGIGDDLVTMDPDGGGVDRIVDDDTVHHREPSWSPDGTAIAYEQVDLGSDPGHRIVVVDADGGNPVIVETDAEQPAWQPAPQAATVTMTPGSAARETGDDVLFTITATDAQGVPVVAPIVIEVTGAHPRTDARSTDDGGEAAYSLGAETPGTDTVVACADLDGDGACGPDDPSATSSVLWSSPADVDPPRLAFTDDADVLYAQQLRRDEDVDTGISYVDLGLPTYATDGTERWEPGATHEGEATRGNDDYAPVFVSTRDSPEGEVYQSDDPEPERITCDAGTERHPVVDTSGRVAYASDADGDWDVYVSIPGFSPRPGADGTGARATACDPFWTTVNVTDEPDGEPVYDDLWPSWTWTADGDDLVPDGLVFSRALRGALPDLARVTSTVVDPDVFTAPVLLTSTPGISETQPAAMVQSVTLPCPDDPCPTVTRRWVAHTTSVSRNSGSISVLDLDAPAVVVPLQHDRRQGTEAAWSTPLNPANLAITSDNDDPYGDIAIAEVRPPSVGASGGLDDVSVFGFQTMPGSVSGVGASHPMWFRSFGEDVDFEATIAYTSRAAAEGDVAPPGRVLHADVSDVRSTDGTQRRPIRRARDLDDGEVVWRYDEAGPSYSPDGTRIVYSSNTNDAIGDVEPRVLMVSDADGTDASLLLDPGQRQADDVDVDPVWSPDGTMVAFVRVRHQDLGPDDPAEVWVYRFGDGSVTRLPGDGVDDLSPSWASDSRHLVVARGDGAAGFELADGARRADLPVPLRRPRLHVLDVTNPGGPGRGLTCGIECDVIGRSPAWSPDGRTIAYELNGELRTVELDSPCCTGPVVATAQPEIVLGIRRSVDDEGDPVRTPTPARDTIATVQDPAWSPDGREIAFSAQPEGQPDGAGIWAIGPGGTGLRLVTDEPGPESEPDYQPQRDADVSVTVTITGSPALVDTPLVATFRVTNNGPVPATDVALTTTFSPGATTNAPAPLPACRADGTGCDFPLLAPGATRQYAVRVRHSVRLLGTATGTVVGDQPDRDLTNNTDSALYRVQGADVEVRILLDQPIGYVGGERAALVTVRNAGADPVEDVEVQAIWPTEVIAYVPPPEPMTSPPAPDCLVDGDPCLLGDLAPGAARRFRVGLEMLLEASVVLEAAVSTTTSEVVVANNVDTLPLEILQPEITVLPGVAPPGKVVLGYGEKMPPGSLVRLTWEPGITVRRKPFRVRADGTLRVPVLIVRHDLLGTRLLTATSVPELFSPIDGGMLVVPRTLAPPNFNGRG